MIEFMPRLTIFLASTTFEEPNPPIAFSEYDLKNLLTKNNLTYNKKEYFTLPIGLINSPQGHFFLFPVEKKEDIEKTHQHCYPYLNFWLWETLSK